MTSLPCLLCLHWRPFFKHTSSTFLRLPECSFHITLIFSDYIFCILLYTIRHAIASNSLFIYNAHIPASPRYWSIFIQAIPCLLFNTVCLTSASAVYLQTKPRCFTISKFISILRLLFTTEITLPLCITRFLQGKHSGVIVKYALENFSFLFFLFWGVCGIDRISTFLCTYAWKGLAIPPWCRVLLCLVVNVK